MSKLYIIGVGPGSKEYITYAAKNTVKNADITVGSQRAMDLFTEVNEKIIFNVKNLTEELKKAVILADNGKSVCILSTGDPGFSGLLKPVKRIIKEENCKNVELTVIPGISSLQLCAARLEISWDEVDILTYHGRENSKDIINILDNGRGTIMLPSRSVADMASFLIENGVNPNRKVVICERLSYTNEKIVKTTLSEVVNSEFTYMCIMVIY